MKNIVCFCVVIFTMGLCHSASAKLGETIEQIEARYGKPLKNNISGKAMIRSYRFGEYRVEVRFLGGKAQMEMMSPVEDGKKLSDDDCLALARAISGAEAWKKERGTFSMTGWTSSSNYMAFRQSKPVSSDIFQVLSKEWADYESTQKKESSKALADKFGSAPKRSTN